MATDSDAFGSIGLELDTRASSEAGQAGPTSCWHSGRLGLSAAAVGVLTVFSVALLLFNGNRPSSDIELVKVADDSLEQNPGHPGGKPAIVEHAEPSLEEVAAKRLDELGARVDTLSRYVDAQLDHLSAQDVSQGDVLSIQEKRLATVEHNLSGLEARVSEIVDQAGTDAEILKALREDVRKSQSARNKAQTANKPKRPKHHVPFSVDTVDLWEGVAYAAVSKGDSRGFLREGDRIPEVLGRGWWVARIDHTKGEVVFADPDGHIHAAEVGR